MNGSVISSFRLSKNKSLWFKLHCHTACVIAIFHAGQSKKGGLIYAVQSQRLGSFPGQKCMSRDCLQFPMHSFRLIRTLVEMGLVGSFNKSFQVGSWHHHSSLHFSLVPLLGVRKGLRDYYSEVLGPFCIIYLHGVLSARFRDFSQYSCLTMCLRTFETALTAVMW